NRPQSGFFHIRATSPAFPLSMTSSTTQSACSIWSTARPVNPATIAPPRGMPYSLPEGAAVSLPYTSGQVTCLDTTAIPVQQDVQSGREITTASYNGFGEFLRGAREGAGGDALGHHVHRRQFVQFNPFAGLVEVAYGLRNK